MRKKYADIVKRFNNLCKIVNLIWWTNINNVENAHFKAQFLGKDLFINSYIAIKLGTFIQKKLFLYSNIASLF